MARLIRIFGTGVFAWLAWMGVVFAIAYATGAVP
jgi:hypothetical protein